MNKAPLGPLYIDKLMSIPDIAKHLGLARSRVRRTLLKEGVKLRGRFEAIRLCGLDKMGTGRRGRKFKFSESHKSNISKGKTGKGKGLTLKPNGYLEITMGPDKGRSIHSIIMEKHIGRRLRKAECVHHIDHDKTNNDINNLRLMTRSSHMRLHRLELSAKGI